MPDRRRTAWDRQRATAPARTEGHFPRAGPWPEERTAAHSPAIRRTDANRREPGRNRASARYRPLCVDSNSGSLPTVAGMYAAPVVYAKAAEAIQRVQHPALPQAVCLVE